MFKRLSECGLTVNEDKCQFGVKEIEFFGMKFSPQGFSLNEQKSQALKEFTTLQNYIVFWVFQFMRLNGSKI